MKKGRKQNMAVAIRYEAEKDNAPKVIASGSGDIAEKIIKLAREHNIHIHSDPELIQVLSQLDLNEEIPRSLYIIIAELLSFVYSLNSGGKR